MLIQVLMLNCSQISRMTTFQAQGKN